ncbi:hypothetical protein CUJ84_pRLN1000971 (plasmid) [Rhizobium leguminosarum]|uniref:Uncharacterized protein n=1 Tax=Rhizobium leguminosarum TaxID=384 RepID=A0A2K9ZDU5_RHILE|nr:hypothetical protein CUJ84_pRLN1000971 [Rhizobium leguminosarum]
MTLGFERPRLFGVHCVSSGTAHRGTRIFRLGSRTSHCCCPLAFSCEMKRLASSRISNRPCVCSVERSVSMLQEARHNAQADRAVLKSIDRSNGAPSAAKWVTLRGSERLPKCGTHFQGISAARAPLNASYRSRVNAADNVQRIVIGSFGGTTSAKKSLPLKQLEAADDVIFCEPGCVEHPTPDLLCQSTPSSGYRCVARGFRPCGGYGFRPCADGASFR